MESRQGHYCIYVRITNDKPLEAVCMFYTEQTQTIYRLKTRSSRLTSSIYEATADFG